MKDKERLDWLQEQDCYSVISDDRGHFACVVEGIQDVPLEVPNDIQTTFFIKKNQWKKSVREAIDCAIERQHKEESDSYE